MLYSTDSLDAIMQLHSIALAITFAGGSGIRATVPLFLASLLHLLAAEQVPLSPAVEWLGHWLSCGVLFALLIVEIVADFVPGVDHALHAIMTPVHTIAGALAAVVPDYAGGVASHLPMAVFGACLALVAHGGKSVGRFRSAAMTAGASSPVKSALGTVGLVAAIVVAVFVLILAVVFAILVVGISAYTFRRLKLAREQFRAGHMREAVVPVLAAVRFRQHARQPSEGGVSIPATEATAPATAVALHSAGSPEANC